MFEFEYYPSRKRRTRRRQRAVARIAREKHEPGGNVVTLIEPSLRSIVDLATEGRFRPVHTDSLESAREAITDRRACAMLFSPEPLRGCRTKDLAGMLSSHPTVYPIGLVQCRSKAVSEEVLNLGKVGVAKVLDMDLEGSSTTLRVTLEDNSGVIMRRIILAINGELPAAGVSARMFFSILVRIAPTHISVRDVASYLDINPSSLISKFYRYALPTPKRYLARIRLLYASAYLEMPQLSIADVSHLLQYSSPQSFARHVHTQLGLSGSEFRQIAFSEVFGRFADELFRRHRPALERLEPFPG